MRLEERRGPHENEDHIGVQFLKSKNQNLNIEL